MIHYREILRLSYLNYTQTDIATSLKCSRNTIRDVVKQAEKVHLSWPLADSWTDQKIEEVLYPGKKEMVNVFCMPDLEYIHQELARPGVNLSLLYAEYEAMCAETGRIAYKRTQFYDLYSKWAKKSKATMRIRHKPGDAMEVDWAGNTLPITDPVTGDATDAYLFVGVLPCSWYAYAELCRDMKSENWLLCHVHAYDYFGGVPRLLIPDNLKAGITKNTRLETVVNRSYLELSEHYQTAVVPARVKRAQDKSHAEGTVKYASTWILAALRNRTFFSFEEARTAVAGKLEELNGFPFKKREGNRRKAYMEEEKAFMQPLPVNPFEPAVWSDAVVLTDYCISDGMNRYSVPYDLIGETVQVRTARDSVEVFFNDNRVACHVRLHQRQVDPVIKMEHMPEKHKKYLSYTKDAFMEWGENTGKYIADVINTFLTEGRAPEQGYKSCRNLMGLVEKYGVEKVDDVCRQVTSYSGRPNIKALMHLLKNPSAGGGTGCPVVMAKGSSGITRGAASFRGGDR